MGVWLGEVSQRDTKAKHTKPERSSRSNGAGNFPFRMGWVGDCEAGIIGYFTDICMCGWFHCIRLWSAIRHSTHASIKRTMWKCAGVSFKYSAFKFRTWILGRRMSPTVCFAWVVNLMKMKYLVIISYASKSLEVLRNCQSASGTYLYICAYLYMKFLMGTCGLFLVSSILLEHVYDFGLCGFQSVDCILIFCCVWINVSGFGGIIKPHNLGVFIKHSWINRPRFANIAKTCSNMYYTLHIRTMLLICINE